MTKIIITLLLSLIGWVFPIHSAAAQTSVIQTNAIARSEIPILVQPLRTSPPTKSGRHSTRSETQISVERLQLYLEHNSSPLAPYSASIMASPYWSTIIGICTIEQYGCTKAPGNNYWGIGGQDGLERFSTPERGIEAISNLLARYEADGKHSTIESLNCYYVQPCSSNWFNTVLTTKQKLESLTTQQ